MAQQQQRTNGQPQPPVELPAPLLSARAAARPLSPSQVTTWIDCQARWYFKHALGLPDPPSIALALGRALHTTYAAALRGKATHAQFSAETLVEDTYLPEMAEALATVHGVPSAEQHEARIKGAEIVRLWYEEALPSIEPEAVEVALVGRIGGVKVRGIADVITADRVVLDHKARAQRPHEISPADRLQLATYGILTHCGRARVDTITKAKQPRYVRQTWDITASDIRHAEQLYPLVAEQIAQGLVLPNRSSNLCSRKHCPFVAQCEREYGGEVS